VLAETPSSSDREYAEVTVKSDSASLLRWLRGSTRQARFGIHMLGAFVVGYLAVITASWAGAPVLTRRLGMLITLWVIGLIVVALLVRG
jgi:hypothetical protein